jgi:hypothetical protein
MTTDRMILDRLERIEGLLRKLLPEQRPVAMNENDYTRSKRQALEARDKAQERRVRRAGVAT